MKEQAPFDSSEIDDVRIIIKAKGKNWSITPKKDVPSEVIREMKLLHLDLIMEFHDIVSTALEDINSEKLKNGKEENNT